MNSKNLQDLMDSTTVVALAEDVTVGDVLVMEVLTGDKVTDHETFEVKAVRTNKRGRIVVRLVEGAVLRSAPDAELLLVA